MPRRGATEHQIEMVYRSRFNQFCSVANAILDDPERAKDAVQEAVASALARRRQWRSRGTVDAWLWRAVVNAAHDEHRKRGSVAADAATDASGETVSLPSVPGSETGIGAALAALPQRQRVVVFLRYYGDLDYRRIAEILDLHAGTVAATLHQAHEKLRRRLEVEVALHD